MQLARSLLGVLALGGLSVLPFQQSWSSGDPVEKLKGRERKGLFIETPTMTQVMMTQMTQSINSAKRARSVKRHRCFCALKIDECDFVSWSQGKVQAFKLV